MKNSLTARVVSALGITLTTMAQRLTGGKNHWQLSHHATIRAFLAGVGLVGLISGCGSLVPTESQTPTLSPRIHPLGADIKREDVPKNALPAFDRADISEQRWQEAKRIADAAQAEHDAATQRQQQVRQKAEEAQQYAAEVQANLEEQQRAAAESERQQRQAQTDLRLLLRQQPQVEAWQQPQEEAWQQPQEEARQQPQEEARQQQQEEARQQQQEEARQQQQEKARLAAEVEKARRDFEAARIKQHQDELNLAAEKERARIAQERANRQKIVDGNLIREYHEVVARAGKVKENERKAKEKRLRDCQALRAKMEPISQDGEEIGRISQPLCN